MINEATKVAARRAVNLSNDGVACSEVETAARNVFQTYASDYGRSMGVTLSTAWNAPDVCLTNATYDGYTRTLLRIRVTNQSTPNCVLCMMNFLRYIPISIDRSFALEWACTGVPTQCL